MQGQLNTELTVSSQNKSKILNVQQTSIFRTKIQFRIASSPMKEI